MANDLTMPKKQQVLALLALAWSYRRIEAETGVRRETVSRYDRQRRANAANTFAGSDTDVSPPEVEIAGADPSNPANTFAGSPSNAANTFPGSRRFAAALFGDDGTDVAAAAVAGHGTGYRRLGDR